MKEKFEITVNNNKIKIKIIRDPNKIFDYEHLYVMYKNNKNKYVYLPKCNNKLCFKINNNNNNNTILICDIVSEVYENHGIGSKFLKLLDKIAISKKINKIYGEISPVDSDHYDKLVHFYEKNGYNIEYKNNTPISINKILNNLF